MIYAMDIRHQGVPHCLRFPAYSVMEDLYSKCEVRSDDPMVSFSVESCGYGTTLQNDDDAFLPQ